MNKVSICSVAVISNLTVCDVCVFHAAVFGEMKLFAARVSCVIFSKVPLMKPLPVVDRSKPNCDVTLCGIGLRLMKLECDSEECATSA